MTTVVSVAQGGTGSNSAALARTALGVPPSAAYDQANTARDQANTARTQANSAYSDANTRLSASGGTLAGDLIITGNLTVSGNSTTLNAEILTIEDADIVLLSNVASTPALNAGIIVNRGTSTNTFLRWDEVTDKWGWSDDGSTTYKFTSALDAYAQANSAYSAANNRVLKAGDTMTGQLNISAGGLLVTGNVGFGTASPSRRLHLSSSGTDCGIRIDNTTSGRPALLLYDDSQNLSITNSSDTGYIAFINGTGAGTERVRIANTGNVGIGATAPQSRLEVNLISGDSSSLMNANAVNDVTLLRAPFGVNPASVSNGQAKWGLRFVGRNDGTYDNGKSAAVYAVSEETAAGYNRSVGLAFHTSGFDASHTERMRIDSPGNLFLGVTPSAWGSGIKVAQVSFGALVSSATNNTLVTSNCYYDGAQWVYLASSSASIYTQSSGLHSWRTAPSGTAGNTVTFSTLMLLDASGRLLVGDTTARTVLNKTIELSSAGTSTNQGAVIVNQYVAAGNAINTGYLTFQRSGSGTLGTNSIVASGDRLGMVRFSGANGTDYNAAAEIYAEVDGTPGASSDMPGRIIFATTADGAGVTTERARITSGGDLCVGSTEPGNAGTRNISIGNPGTTVGGLQLWSTTSGTHYVQFGDSASGGAPYSGAIGYTHTDNALLFYTNQSLRATLDSVGNFALKGAAGTYSLDTTFTAASYANGATVDFPSMSGMIIANDQLSTGYVTIWLVGGGNTTAAASHGGTPVGSMAYNGAVAGYRWTNNSGETRSVAFAVFRTRNTA